MLEFEGIELEISYNGSKAGEGIDNLCTSLEKLSRKLSPKSIERFTQRLAGLNSALSEIKTDAVANVEALAAAFEKLSASIPSSIKVPKIKLSEQPKETVMKVREQRETTVEPVQPMQPVAPVFNTSGMDRGYLDISGKIQLIKEAFGELSTGIREKMGDAASTAREAMGAVGQEISNFTVSHEPLRRIATDLSEIKGMFGQAGAAIGNFAGSAVKTAASGMNMLASAANKARGAISSMASAFKKTGSAAKHSQSALEKWLGIIKHVVILRPVRQALNAIANGLRDGVNNLVRYSAAMNSLDAAAANNTMSAYATKLLEIKNAVGAAVMPALRTLLPVVNAVSNAFITGVNAINQFISALQGKTSFTRAKETAVDYAAALDASNKKAKALKQSLQSFDELHTLDADNTPEATNIGKNYTDMFEEVKINPDISNFKDKITSMFSDLAEPIKNAFAKVDLTSTAKNMLNTWKGVFSDMGKSFNEVWTNGTGESIMTHLVKIADNLMASIDNIGRKWREAWNKDDTGTHIVQNVMETIDKLAGLAENISGDIKEWSADLNWEPLLTNVEKLTKAFSEFLDDVSPDVEAFFKEVLLPLGKWIIEDAGPVSVDTLAKSLKGLGDTIDAASPAVGGFWKNIAAPGYEKVGNMLTDSIEAFGDSSSTLSGMLNGEIPLVEGALRILKNDLKIAWNSFIPSWPPRIVISIIEKHFGSIPDWIQKNVLDKVVKSFEDLKLPEWIQKHIIDDIGQKIQKAPDFIVENLIKPFVKDFADLEKFIKQTFLDACEGVKDSFLKTVEWLDNHVVKPISESFGKIKESIVKAFGEAWKAVGDGVVSAMNGAIGVIEGALNGIIGAINTFLGGFNTIASKAGEILGKDWKGVGKLQTVTLKRIAQSGGSGRKFAEGGMPDKGSMFIANEEGPELVGTIGKRTTVANNLQIIEGIKQGVSVALAAAGGFGGAEITVPLYLDGKEVGRAVIDYHNGVVYQTGVSPLVI